MTPDSLCATRLVGAPPTVDCRVVGNRQSNPVQPTKKANGNTEEGNETSATLQAIQRLGERCAVPPGIFTLQLRRNIRSASLSASV